MTSLILIILIITPGVWSGDWRVIFKDQCALQGSSVVIKCEYDYPTGPIVISTRWSKIQDVSGSLRLVLLSDLPSPPGHFRYVGDLWTDCSLQIDDVQLADQGQYYFSFLTTLGRLTSRSFSQLSVKDLKAIVQPSTVTEGGIVSLTCVSECPEPVYVVWSRDGQPVLKLVFQAKREDAGKYYCAVYGQQWIRSASVALTVLYAPGKVALSMSPLGNNVKGSSVTFTCSSDGNPPVSQSGFSLYKDGQFLQTGQNYTISDIQPSHSGLYYCQAWNSISFFDSAEVHLDVQYHPVNISISMNPPHVVEGSSANLTCSSAANPAANYTWYMHADSASSLLWVGSGQMLPLPFVEASNTGVYLCQARNQLGADNSTEMPVIVTEEELGQQSLPIIAGIGVFLVVTLVLALFLWRRQTSNTEKKALASYEDEVVYSTVTIKPRHPSGAHHKDSSKALQHRRLDAEENEGSVIYATVVESS